jgi:hypothetical protein
MTTTFNLNVHTSRDRAAFAAETLTAHALITERAIDLTNPFATLLADLMHHADAMCLDFDAALAAARTAHGELVLVERDDAEEGQA